MELIPLSSSLIHSIAYNPEYKSLQINFHQGNIYIYYNVPKSIYKGLINAASPGKYYNKHIKGKFKSEKASPELLK